MPAAAYLYLLGTEHYKEANFLSRWRGFSYYLLSQYLIAHYLRVQKNKFFQMKEQMQ